MLKEMKERNFLLTMHSTYFYFCYMALDVLVKDHSDSKRGNPLLPPHGLLFPISSKDALPPDRIAHTTAFVTPVVVHWLE